MATGLQTNAQSPGSIETLRRSRWVMWGFWVSVIISLAIVSRRLVELMRPAQGRPPQMASIDATFSSHAFLTVMHIVPAAILVVLAAAVLMLRKSNAWLERLLFLCGALTGVTAYAMGSYAIGGWVERSAVIIFDTYFLFALSGAFWWGLRGDAARKREWLIRAIGVLLGIATTRPVMGVFFATSARTHLGPGQFFGIAFWIGFSINAVAVELWLRSRRTWAALE